MINEHDQLAAQVVRQVARTGNPRHAASAGASAAPGTRPSASRVVDGQVKRLWLVGDPWTAGFYFGAYN